MTGYILSYITWYLYLLRNMPHEETVNEAYMATEGELYRNFISVGKLYACKSVDFFGKKQNRGNIRMGAV